MSASDQDWTKPAALAIPKEGYFEIDRGRYGPVFPRTPACYGFSIIAKVKEGREDTIREHGKTIQAAITETPEFLAPLRLHYLRWLLFDIGDGLTFQYQGIFDTDFDKYTEDAVQLFGQSGINTIFTNLEDFPEDWKEEPRLICPVRSRTPLPELFGIRRVPVRHRPRDQEGTPSQGGLLGHARPDAVALRAASRRAAADRRRSCGHHGAWCAVYRPAGCSAGRAHRNSTTLTP